MRLGNELRMAREDAGISLSRLAGVCGLSKGQLYRIEAGTSQPGWETLARLCVALGRKPGLTLYPASDPLIRDHLQALMIGELIRIAHARWRRSPEVPVYRPVRGVVDLVLDAADEPTLACEAQSDLRRIEQQVRWARAKADALGLARQEEDPSATGLVVSRLLLLRSTARTRAVMAQYADLVAAAYPARAIDAYAAITGEAPWPGDALLWCRMEDGRATILEHPPRGIRVGR
jgi:transcriptional regulator with XRE-family HTH domain